MSELKAVHAFDVYEAYTKTGDDEAAQVYLKPDVDAAIAEKDSKITELKAKLAYAKATAYAESVDAGMRERKMKRALWQARANRALEKNELNWNKYKRCLAMAERCKYRMYYLAAVVEQEASKIIPLKAQIQWYQKRESRMDYWKKRWLELAEKFKEAK